MEDVPFAELSACVAERFGLQIKEHVPVRQGWLNRKWRIRTDRGEWFLKQYDRRRYDDRNTGELRLALTRQNRLREAGVPCPRLLTRDGEALQTSPSGERFAVMEVCRGSPLRPGRFTGTQLYRLGVAAGRMHRVLNDGTLEKKERPAFILPSVQDRLAYLDRVERDVRERKKEYLLPLLDLHRKAAERFDPSAVADAGPGWAHRDLWADNVLFDGDELSAILDFDRLRFDYPEADVARALMSCCLADGRMDWDLAHAFLAGYRSAYPFARGALPRSLHLLYWMAKTGG